MADRGYVEGTHTMPSAALTFTDTPSGLRRLPCAIMIASELPDPGRMGTAL